MSTRVLTFACLILAALNLRMALGSLSVTLPEIILETGISGTQVSLLTAVPLFCLGLMGFAAPPLAARIGIRRAIVVTLVVLVAATALRGLEPFAALLAGAMGTGACCGLIGVLIPTLIKRDFAAQIKLMTGVATMCISGGAAISAAVMPPLTRALNDDWRLALAFWAVFALLTAMTWLPLITQRIGVGETRLRPVAGVLRHRTAWLLTAYMALQSGMAYMIFAWFAPLMRDRDVSPAQSGLILAAIALVQVISIPATPYILAHARRPGLIAAAPIALMMIGSAGCAFAPLALLWPSAIVLGIGQGMAFAVALTLIVLRSENEHVTAAVSAVAQAVGYMLAAILPLAGGVARDLAGDWSATEMIYAVAGVAGIWVGLVTGGSRVVAARFKAP